ncbi:hypothetical protein H5410_060609 [Solanum commersonii]|uniref:Polyprotein protein n=1 Tax=Solanum commersonii TaxID=4109 RepID=A0A9J5W5I0_SOLCO|nr:hypothetical protein H5410_060609 [Solanum commersonii]
MPIASTDIRRNEAEYLKDQEKGRKKKQWSISITTAAPADTPSSSAAALPPKPTTLVASSRPSTQASLLRMGQLALFADRRATILEASISGMIRTHLADAVKTLSTTIDALAVRIAVCEQIQGATEEVTTLKAAIAEQ